jgi:hypothetical protein
LGTQQLAVSSGTAEKPEAEGMVRFRSSADALKSDKVIVIDAQDKADVLDWVLR